MLKKILPELFELEELAEKYKDFLEIEKLSEVSGKDQTLPLYAFSIGSKDKTKPTLALFGGVHGLERVGTHVLIAYLNNLLSRLEWDKSLQNLLEECRIVSIPLINPLGTAFVKRSNYNGVDLMRNAPVDAVKGGKTLPLLSGHHISPKLPWYRGSQEKLEIETQTVIDFCKREFFQSKQVISIDLHSGFGLRDRLWYPWAKTSEPFPHIHEVESLTKLFNKTYPYHIYIIEPQANNYRTHGDLWDYIYSEYQKENRDGSFLPLTLEMGSWMWVKKNPLQAFNPLGYFNPIKKHRYSRVMRRHLHLLDFLLNANIYREAWK